LRNAPFAIAIALLGIAAGAAAAQALGQVSGRVTILEKDPKAGGDLSDAVLWLERVPGDTAVPRTFDITINDKIYTPRVVVAPVGSTAQFPNHDPFKHNVFSVSEPNGFDVGLFGRNESRSKTFATPGLVRIYCNIHPRMVAYVVLVANRYYTQPADDGTFTIAGVPSGRYKLNAWHERIPSMVTQDVVVGASARPVAIQLDARKYRWQQHKNKFGKTYPSNAGRERY
jgi:plastocyanin